MALVNFFKILLDRAKSHKIKIFTILEQPDGLAAYLSAIFMQDAVHHNRQGIDGLAHICDTAIQMEFDILWN